MPGSEETQMSAASEASMTSTMMPALLTLMRSHLSGISQASEVSVNMQGWKTRNAGPMACTSPP